MFYPPGTLPASQRIQRSILDTDFRLAQQVTSLACGLSETFHLVVILILFACAQLNQEPALVFLQGT
jgi:hypothetical protein